jgi:hypothetical protein
VRQVVSPRVHPEKGNQQTAQYPGPLQSRSFAHWTGANHIVGDRAEPNGRVTFVGVCTLNMGWANRDAVLVSCLDLRRSELRRVLICARPFDTRDDLQFLTTGLQSHLIENRRPFPTECRSGGRGAPCELLPVVFCQTRNYASRQFQIRRMRERSGRRSKVRCVS